MKLKDVNFQEVESYPIKFQSTDPVFQQGTLVILGVLNPDYNLFYYGQTLVFFHWVDTPTDFDTLENIIRFYGHWEMIDGD